jgi:hypothetical protein
VELTFEHYQEIGEGSQPAAIHTAENIVQVIYVGTNGSIYAIEASTPMGEWANREFSTPYMICSDVDVIYMKLKYIASSIFVVWRNATEEGEVVPYVPDTVHALRHRFAVWTTRHDFSKYLIDGSIDFSMDDPVTKLSLNFENPSYILSHEDSTLLTPGTSILLFFRSGDSARYIMGRYYVDKNDMGVLEAETSVEGRNGIGKFLKDQSFDEQHTYAYQNLQTFGQSIMDWAGVKIYQIGDTEVVRGMEFPPDMNLLDGVQELIKTVPIWKIEEDLTGKINFGSKNDPMFIQPATYTFHRDTDIFSRSVSRDDQDAYARVCVHNDDYSIAVYRNVDFRFVMGAKKTLHVAMVKGSDLSDATEYANTLAGLLKNVGTVETFDGPFRPHLRTGDNAKIIGPNTKLLGIMTSVRHKFGRSGFFTEFVVDSGERANKTRISDYISKIAGDNKSQGQAERLYS